MRPAPACKALFSGDDFTARLIRDAFLTELPETSCAGSRPLCATHSRTVSYAHFVGTELELSGCDSGLQARGRTGEILGQDKKEIVPGKDFAMTEIVHCKSRNEEGVEDAEDCCSTLYLERILTISPARVVIVYGARAKRVVNSRFGSTMNPLRQNLSTLSLGRWSRIVAFLPHPNERGSEKTLAANIGDVGLELIHTHLADCKHP